MKCSAQRGRGHSCPGFGVTCRSFCSGLRRPGVGSDRLDGLGCRFGIAGFSSGHAQSNNGQKGKNHQDQHGADAQAYIAALAFQFIGAFLAQLCGPRVIGHAELVPLGFDDGEPVGIQKHALLIIFLNPALQELLCRNHFLGFFIWLELVQQVAMRQLDHLAPFGHLHAHQKGILQLL